MAVKKEDLSHLGKDDLKRCVVTLARRCDDFQKAGKWLFAIAVVELFIIVALVMR